MDATLPRGGDLPSRDVRDLLHEARIHGLYVHVPFCFHKCHYCDFYSIVDSLDRQAAFADRLIDELEAASRWLQRPLQSVFVGGGTPTLLRPELWRRLLDGLHGLIQLDHQAEFTVEANPETVTEELAEVLAQGGVNRVSIGAQSFNQQHLKTLERWHEPENVGRSVRTLRQAGIGNLNLDLIFAIPGQTLDDVASDLEQALSLEPDHLSCYSLMFEPNTPLTMRMKAGRIAPIDQDVEAAMYELIVARLADAGFEQYEISNWAKPGRRCEHNLTYWRNRNWWPLGPSASGHVNGLRWKNVPRLAEYLEHGPLPPVVDVERLDDDGRAGEAFMLGLRLIDGLPRGLVNELLQQSERGGVRRSAAISHHIASGLLEWRSDALRLTRNGVLLADRVVASLL